MEGESYLAFFANCIVGCYIALIAVIAWWFVVEQTSSSWRIAVLILLQVFKDSFDNIFQVFSVHSLSPL